MLCPNCFYIRKVFCKKYHLYCLTFEWNEYISKQFKMTNIRWIMNDITYYSRLGFELV